MTAFHSPRALPGALAIAVCLYLNPTLAQYAGSPALPAAEADYVDYAVTSLPSYYAPGSAVGNTNNTPSDNAITNAGATLGRVLFYDKRLSHNNSVSCASCHQQDTGFTDPNQFSTGFDGGLTGRHSMGLSNAMFYQNGSFFWDERAATLEDQVLEPIINSVEMGSTLSQVRTELAATDFYPELFNSAFGSTEITDDKISKALAQFVRSMVSYETKLDTALAAGDPGSPEFESELTAQEILGRNIFHGAGRCANCHSEEAQVADRTHNIGLDIDNSADEGAGNGEFKVPSLRNIAVRGKYMHDGRFSTLEEVIDFYSTGIQDNPDLALGLRTPGGGGPVQFNFTQQQKNALIAYLETLTDSTLLTSDLFSDPFVELVGDFDDNGLVEMSDLTLWERGYASGEFSGIELLDWQANLGKSWQDLSPAPDIAVVAVPEPAAVALVLLGILFNCKRMKRDHPDCQSRTSSPQIAGVSHRMSPASDFL